MADFRKALVVAWLVISLAGLLLAAVPLVVSQSALSSVVPQCEARARGERCIACGMTTGFFAIANGDLKSARLANAAAIPLFSADLVNAACAAMFLYSRKARPKRQKGVSWD